VADIPEPDWYFEHVLADAQPGRYAALPRGAVGGWQAWWREQAAGTDPAVTRAAEHGFVLSNAERAALGFSRQNARSAIRRGAWTAAGRGFVSPLALVGDGPDVQRRRHAVRAGAAAQSRRDESVTCRSAAVLHGLPTLRIPRVAELTARRPAGSGPHPVSHIYRAALSDREVTRWYGIEVTTVARTLVDLARHDRRDAIMAADAALGAGLVGYHDLDRALATACGWPGVRQARAVLAIASPLAESPLESLARLFLHADGFPVPELQVQIGEYRVDMLLREQRLILEIDGLGKYTIAELRREKRRELRLRALGYRVERLGWDEIMRNWPQTSAWLRRLLLHT
jgi:very-short-patch-repair endonuclease